MQKFNVIGTWKSKNVQQHSPEEIFIKDPQALKAKLAKLIKDGPENLQIVTDFDQTITSFSSPATFSIFRQSPYAPQEFRINMQKHFDYYVPIEKDQSLKVEEKNKYMHEWYEKVSKEFKHAQFSKKMAEQILNTSKIHLRFLFDEFFNECYTKNVPFHIVSGGVDQIINMILNSLQSINEYKELTINTNLMQFEEDLITRMEMIVTATTKATVLQSHGIAIQPNTLLLGDLPSDYYMTKFLNLPNQVAIGFLDINHKDLIEEYTKLYDIVIMGEPSFLVAKMILSKACKDQVSEELITLFNRQEYDEVRSLF